MTSPTTKDFSCFIAGVPEPQGSARAFIVNGRAVITTANPRLKKWRAAMAKGFAAYWRQEPMQGPLVLSAAFVLPRLASHPKIKQGRVHPIAERSGDLDKLLRAVGDSLKDGKVIVDDALICEFGKVTKRYASVGEGPGVSIILEPMEVCDAG